MKKELAKTFSPVDIETKWYRYWESNGYYKMGEDESKLDSFQFCYPLQMSLEHFIWGMASIKRLWIC